MYKKKENNSERKKILTEENYEQIRKKFKKVILVGVLIILIGVGIIALGIFLPIGDLMSDTGFGSLINNMIAKTFLIFFGFPIIIAGLITTIFGLVRYHRRDLLVHTAQSTLPIAGEAVEKVVDFTAPAVGKITSTITDAVSSSKSKNKNVETELEKLKDLKDRNLINEEEYEKLRKKALDI